MSVNNWLVRFSDETGIVDSIEIEALDDLKEDAAYKAIASKIRIEGEIRVNVDYIRGDPDIAKKEVARFGYKLIDIAPL